MNRKRKKGKSGRNKPCNKEAFLIFAAKESRQKRVIALQNYASMAYCKLGLQKLVAIGTENLSAKNRSYDVILQSTFCSTHHIAANDDNSLKIHIM